MNIPGRTAPLEPDRIRDVFLSATAKDLKQWRERVQQALRGLEADVFLQEEWNDGAANVVLLCLQRFSQSDAYLGLLGYRYGWIPQGYDKSITEIECDKALERWRAESNPPVFVFVPALPSDAAREFSEAAEAALADDFPNDPDARERSRQRQRTFATAVAGQGNFVRSFSTTDELILRAIYAVSNWNADAVTRAAARRTVGITTIPEAELGAIDRQLQRDAIDAALLSLVQSESPGLALVVHGPEGAGQLAFLAHLADANPWSIGGAPQRITPPHDRFDASSIVAAAISVLAPGYTSSAATIDVLARVLRDRCRVEDVVMFLTSVERLTGGLEAFHARFWRPLLEASVALERPAAGTHRFIVVTSSASPLRAPLPAHVTDAAPGTARGEYEKLVLLPELGEFTRTDVSRWLTDLGMNLQARNTLLNQVMQDGVPRNVFDRLKTDGFWPSLHR